MRKSKTDLNRKINSLNNKKGDIVKVVNFQVTPKRTKPGDMIKIKFTVQNLNQHTLKLVPWRIVNDKKIIYSGYRFNLPAGSSFDVTTSWKAEKGNHFIFADVDPQNILNEPREWQLNNFPQGVDVVVGK